MITCPHNPDVMHAAGDMESCELCGPIDLQALRAKLTLAIGHHQRFVDHWFGNPGKTRPLASIPANHAADSDLIVSDALRDALKLIDSLEAQDA